MAMQAVSAYSHVIHALTSEASFASSVYHVLYNAGRFRVMDGRGMSLRVIFTFTPLISSFYGSFSGISDNRHYLDDVLFGAFLGSSMGVIFYFIYFPSIFDPLNCGRAYPPRRLGVSFLLGPLACFFPLDETPRVVIEGLIPEITVVVPQMQQTYSASVPRVLNSLGMLPQMQQDQCGPVEFPSCSPNRESASATTTSECADPNLAAALPTTTRSGKAVNHRYVQYV